MGDFGGAASPHQLPDRLAAGDSSQAWTEPTSLLPCLSPLSPIREVAESTLSSVAVQAAGGGDTIAGLDHLTSCAARIQGLGGGVRARAPGDAYGRPLQESNAEKPVQSSKERYWQIRERFLSK